MYLEQIIFATLGLFIGINLAYILNFSSQFFFLSLFLALINFLIYKFSKKNFGVYKNKIPLLLSFLFLFLSLGILLGQASLSKAVEERQAFESFIKKEKVFKGEISKISFTEKSQQIFLELEKEKGSKNSFKLKLITHKIPEYKIGDYLEIEGKVIVENTILPKVTEGEKVFNSYSTETLNSLRKINGEISFPKIKIIENENYKIGFLKKGLYKLANIKVDFVKKLDSLSPRESAALSAGTTLGDDSLFSKKELENFRVSGLSHLIVLSGFNITILISFLFFIFLNLKIRLKWRIVLTISSIIVFIIFVGGGPSILRAGIMGSVLLLSFLFGKQYAAKQILFLVAFFMMIFSPKIAVSDISFHLSFLATFGILYLSPIFDNYRFWKKWNKEDLKEKDLSFKDKIIKNIFDILKITLIAQISVLPYIAFKFGSISLFGLFANILVLPFIPIVMLLAFLVLVFSYFLPSISILLAYLSYIFARYIFGLTNYLAAMPASEIKNNFSFSFMLIFYFILIFYIYFENKRHTIKKLLENY